MASSIHMRMCMYIYVRIYIVPHKVHAQIAGGEFAFAHWHLPITCGHIDLRNSSSWRRCPYRRQTTHSASSYPQMAGPIDPQYIWDPSTSHTVGNQ